MLFYTPFVCRHNPNWLFVFGDNYAKWGKAGQACIRDEPNAVGIDTKRYPGMEPEHLLSDNDFDEWLAKNTLTIEMLRNTDKRIVWPDAGIGTGLAKLPEKAPKIFKYIEDVRKALE